MRRERTNLFPCRKTQFCDTLGTVKNSFLQLCLSAYVIPARHYTVRSILLSKDRFA